MTLRIALAIAVSATTFCATATYANPDIGTIRVASGLNRPVGVTHAPDDETRLFIIEKPGRIRILDLTSGNLLATNFLDISALVNGGTTQNDERGLLGVAFHPNYAENGYFYVNYFSTSNAMTIRRYTVSANPNVADTGSGLTLLTIPQFASNHNGGWLGFSPVDGYLYIASGDGGGANDTGNNAQNRSNLLGTMLRIDVDNPDMGLNYGIPTDNPFVGDSGRPEIWAYGLRNPWRNSFDRLTGDLYIGDVGQNQWEEINFQPASSTGGENYGWRCYEGNATFNTSGCGPQSDYDFPIHVYPIGGQPECAVTGGYVYRGQDIPGLDGTYFFADYCSAKVWSFRYNGSVSQFTNQTAQLSPSQDGHAINFITSFGEDARGELYIVSQPSNATAGAVFKVVFTGQDPPKNDECKNAIVVSSGATQFSNEGATTSGPTEAANCTFFGDGNIQSDIWFVHTAECTGELTVSLCGSSYVTKLAVYGESCPTSSGSTIACDVSSCPGELRSIVSFPAVQGQTFRIRVGGHNGAQGTGQMTISCEPEPVDDCVGDLNGDNSVDVSDLLILFGQWGPCKGCSGDLNDDNFVDVSDLLLLFAAWGACE